MRKVIVRYETKPEAAEENQALVEAVFTELAQSQPEGLGYGTFRLEDGVSFVHVAFIDGENPLSQSAAFAAFQENIGDRCVEPPVAKEVTLVGSYGLFA